MRACDYELQQWRSTLLGNRKYTQYTQQEKNLEQQAREHYLRCVKNARSFIGGSRPRSRPRALSRPMAKKPRTFLGPNHGEYVRTTHGHKLYVPKNSVWTHEGSRWRIHLDDGRSMLYPKLM